MLVLCVGVVVSIAAPTLHVKAHQMTIERASLVVLDNLTDLFGSMAIDLSAKGRIHPVSLIGVPVFLAALLKVQIYSLSSLWQNVGRALLSPFV